MKVMIISINPWDDTNSLGNTVSNFFGDWKEAEFFSIYFRGGMPDNGICKKYFKISEKMMLKSFLNKKNCGQYFENYEKKPSGSSRGKKKILSFIHKYNPEPIYRIFDFLWSRKTWQNDRFIKEIKEFSPDIVFSFAKADAQYYHTLKYIKQHTNAKIVLFCADDVYTVYENKKSGYGRVLAKRFREIMSFADKIYGISTMMCDFYKSMFSREISLLRKGCTGFSPVKNQVGCPVKLVYAGNLLYGRYDILCDISRAVKNLAPSQDAVKFEIYSGDSLSEKESKELQNQYTQFMGRRSYEEVEKILEDSDVVIHVESFDKEQIEKTRFSFSTKIIDCLKSGSMLLAIGPGDLASISEAKIIPGTLVVESREGIDAGVEWIISNKNEIPKNAAATQKYAMKNHHIDEVRNGLWDDFCRLLEN